MSLVETDTDSYYCVLAERDLDDCLKLEKKCGGILPKNLII